MCNTSIENREITKDEFIKWMQLNLFCWLSDRSRSLTAHLLGVEEWARIEFNRAYKKEKNNDQA